jgi:cytochrome c peroxidase
MHDGSISCSAKIERDDAACAIEALGAVVDHYRKGGAPGSERDANITGFEITEGERRDLIEFLKSLTDEEFISNPAFSDPFAEKI